jgi:hypothetical protein
VVETFIILFAAHAVGDFALQTDRDVAGKHRLAVLARHGLLHAVAALLLAGTWRVWLPVLISFLWALVVSLFARWIARKI